MNIGKLHQIKKYYWLLYPTKDIAADYFAAPAPVAPATAAADVAAARAACWSKYFNCKITYIPENSIFCLLAEEGNFLKILSTNGELGWIARLDNEDWLAYFKEVKQ